MSTACAPIQHPSPTTTPGSTMTCGPISIPEPISLSGLTIAVEWTDMEAPRGESDSVEVLLNDGLDFGVLEHSLGFFRCLKDGLHQFVFQRKAS